MSQNIPLSERLPKCRIFLGNLASEKTSKGELRNIFAKYGNIIEDPVLRRSFGFIQYDNPDSALKAIEGEQGRIIGGMKLDLSIADNREPRSGRNNNNNSSNNNNNNNSNNNHQRKDKKGSNNGNTSPSRGNSRHDKRAERRNERAPYEKRDFNRDNYRNNNNNGNRRRLRSPEQDEIPKILCQVVYLDKQQRDYARKISKKIQENSIPCEDYFIENQSVEHTIKRAIRRDINYILFVGSHNEKLNTTNLELLHSDGKESYPDIPFSQAIELLIKEEEVKGRRPSNSFNKNVHGDLGPIINNNFADHHNYSQTNGHPNFDLSSFLANSYISQMPFNNQPANVLSLLSSILANSNSTTSFPNTASSSPISSLMNGFNSYSNPSQHQSGLSVPNGNSSSTSSNPNNNSSSNNNTSSNNNNSNNANPTSNNASNGTSNSSNNHTPNVNNLQIDPMTLQQLLSQQSLNNLMLSSNLNQLANQLSVLQSTSFAYNNNTTNNGLNGHTPPASAQNNTSNLNYTPQSNGSSSNGSSSSSTFNHHNSVNNEYRPMVHSNANSGSNNKSSTQDLVAQQMSLQKNLREMLNSQRSNPPFENGNSGGKTSDSSSSSNSMYNNNNLALLFNQNPSSQSSMNYNP